MLATQHFRWLPNTLTITRILLAFVVAWAAADGRWVLGFWVLVIALFTDFLDGLAAKKLNAMTPLGKQLDRRADALLSGGGLVGLVLAGFFPWWGVVVAGLIALIVSEERFFPFKTGLLHRRRATISVSYLFSVWIYIGLMYITQAYGWSWWYVVLVAVILLGSASLKRHRLRAWLGMR